MLDDMDHLGSSPRTQTRTNSERGIVKAHNYRIRRLFIVDMNTQIGCPVDTGTDNSVYPVSIAPNSGSTTELYAYICVVFSILH